VIPVSASKQEVHTTRFWILDPKVALHLLTRRSQWLVISVSASKQEVHTTRFWILDPKVALHLLTRRSQWLVISVSASKQEVHKTRFYHAPSVPQLTHSQRHPVLHVVAHPN
jgi:hypothetical protein